MSTEEKAEKMDLKAIKKICRQQGLYSTPELNDVLHLNNQTLLSVPSALEHYTGVKSLHLSCNGIAKIEHLAPLTELRCLFVQQNCIESLSGIEGNVNLSTLNVSNNQLREIDGAAIRPLERLETLMAAHNRFKTTDSVRGLLERPTITVLDLQHCAMEEPEAVTDVIMKLPNLKVLYLMGNPVVSKVKNYRRTLISSIPTLTYLDQRPVFPEERRMAEAWARGGREAEKAEREAIGAEKRAKEERNFLAFRKMVDEGRRKMEAERGIASGQEKKKAEGADGVEGATAEDAGDDDVPDLEDAADQVFVTKGADASSVEGGGASEAVEGAAAPASKPTSAAASVDPDEDLLTSLD